MNVDSRLFRAGRARAAAFELVGGEVIDRLAQALDVGRAAVGGLLLRDGGGGGDGDGEEEAETFSVKHGFQSRRLSGKPRQGRHVCSNRTEVICTAPSGAACEHFAPDGAFLPTGPRRTTNISLLRSFDSSYGSTNFKS